MKTIKELCFLMICFMALPIALYGQGYEQKSLYEDAVKVRELYENDMFVSLQNEVSGMLGRYEDIPDLLRMEMEAYYTFSVIKLKQEAIDGAVVEYESKYPFSPMLSRVKFCQSVHYFEKQDYSRSLSIMNAVKNDYLSKSERWEYMFNKAYCNMRMGDNKKAMVGFRQIVSSDQSPYKAASNYYLGYLNYITSDFAQAISFFQKLERHHEFSGLAMYYITESYFMMKQYNDAINYGEKVYEKLDGDFKLKCVRILSQSHFELGRNEDAKKYLEIYSSQNDNLSRKDNYYAGVVSYSLQSYYAAIDAFSKVTQQSDSLAQNAYLYLGNSYLKIKNKLNALEAFKSAANLEYDATIRQEAYFLYAKLAFDLNGDIEPFTTYVSRYPSSARGDEIYNYIATSYLRDKNYKDAIDVLMKVDNPLPAMTLNLQKASYFRGMQLFEMNSFRSAIECFGISVDNGEHNHKLAQLAKFWMGEAYYRMNNFQKTLAITKPLVENKSFAASGEYPMGLVNMGYSYFSVGDYPNARVWFGKYLDLVPSKRNMTLEVKTRVADCYYMEKDYERAAELYEEVSLKTFSKDDIYATYMGALSYGLNGQPKKKISLLDNIIANKPYSDYYHRSVYELGRTYVQEEEYADAVKCFDLLVNDRKDSTYLTKSMLELGMINSNLSKYDKALSYFTDIVERYPLSGDVQSALAGIETVYQLLNKPQMYLSYLEKVGMSSIKSADEKEQMLFNSAEQLFLTNRYDEALESLNEFIKVYPDGARTPQAYFYLAQTYQKKGKPEFAADAYMKVMSTGDGAFMELATLYYGRVEYELEHFGQAAQAFEKLGEIAQLENNKFEALVGKMRSYYQLKEYDKSIVAAHSVAVSAAADQDIRIEANYVQAKSKYAKGNREEAVPLFEKLVGDYSTAFGAEAAYILALNAYDEGDFEKVENLVYAFSDAGTPHMYWLAKSFIVLGDSFAERGEWEQAKATFESIKDGYTPKNEHDEVLEQVQMRLSKIGNDE